MNKNQRQKLMTEAHKLELKFQNYAVIGYLRRKIVRKYLRELKGCVLEVGSGRGEDTSFVKNGKLIIGLDLDRKILQYYTRKTKACGICGDATEIPFRDEKFDAVSCIDVLEHVPRDEKVIQEICRVLKPSGKFVFSVPLNQRLYGKSDEFLGHLRRYDVKKLHCLLKKKGFKIIEKQMWGTLLFPYQKIARNRMNSEKLKNWQNRKFFSLYKEIYPIVKFMLNLDFIIPQIKSIGVVFLLEKNETGDSP